MYIGGNNMTNNELNDLIQSICDKEGIIFHNMENDEEHCRGYDLFDASSCGGNEIWIGKYSDVTIKAASFFHELSHTKLCKFQSHKDMCIYNREVSCWINAIAMFQQYDFVITEELLLYINKCLTTYRLGVGYDDSSPNFWCDKRKDSGCKDCDGKGD